MDSSVESNESDDINSSSQAWDGEEEDIRFSADFEEDGMSSDWSQSDEEPAQPSGNEHKIKYLLIEKAPLPFEDQYTLLVQTMANTRLTLQTMGAQITEARAEARKLKGKNLTLTKDEIRRTFLDFHRGLVELHMMTTKSDSNIKKVLAKCVSHVSNATVTMPSMEGMMFSPYVNTTIPTNFTIQIPDFDESQEELFQKRNSRTPRSRRGSISTTKLPFGNTSPPASPRLPTPRSRRASISTTKPLLQVPQASEVRPTSPNPNSMSAEISRRLSGIPMLTPRTADVVVNEEDLEFQLKKMKQVLDQTINAKIFVETQLQQLQEQYKAARQTITELQLKKCNPTPSNPQRKNTEAFLKSFDRKEARYIEQIDNLQANIKELQIRNTELEQLLGDFKRETRNRDSDLAKTVYGAQSQYKQELRTIKNTHQTEIQALKEHQLVEMAALEKSFGTERRNLQKKHEKELSDIKKKHLETSNGLKDKIGELTAQLVDQKKKSRVEITRLKEALQSARKAIQSLQQQAAPPEPKEKQIEEESSDEGSEDVEWTDSEEEDMIASITISNNNGSSSSVGNPSKTVSAPATPRNLFQK